MEKKALLKTAVVRFMLVAAMVLGAALLPGGLLSVRAETTQLPDAVDGTIKLTDGVSLSTDWEVNENVTLDTDNHELIMENNTITISSGVTLTVSGTISVESGKTLTVNGQGTLIVTGANGGYAAGYRGTNGYCAISNSGTLIVDGANVTATGGNGGDGGEGKDGGEGGDGAEGEDGGNGGDGAEGEDGGDGGEGITGNVTVKSGSLTVTGGNGGKGGNGGEGITGNVTLVRGAFKISGGNPVVSGKVTIDEGAVYRDDGTPVSYYTGELPSGGITSINGKTLSPVYDMYTVSINDRITNGTLQATEGAYTTISTSPVILAQKNTTVTLTGIPEEGYQLDTVTVRATSNASTTVNASPTDNVNVRTFTMLVDPAYDVTVSATFTKAPVSTSYLDDKGESYTVQAIPLDAAMTTLGASNKEMWYVVPANTTLDYTSNITLAGNVNLILADGAVMNVGTETDRISGSGISGNEKNLTVDANEYGIYMQNGSFIQNSGKVVADHMINGSSENCGGGIYCENFTVNGGSLDALILPSTAEV